MTGRRISLRGFAATAAAFVLLLTAVPTLAEDGSGDGAHRSRPSSVKVSGSSSGQHGAQPRSQTRSQPSSSTRSHSTAVPRGSVPGREVGQRRPTGYRTPVYPGGYHGDFTVYWGPYGYPWGGWWGWWGWWPYYPYAGYDVRYYPTQARPSMGALDLDLRPEEAEVYLNGQLIGIADNFDGWPHFLWLEQGTYDLVFYHDGFETIARQYSVYPGVIIDVEDFMVPGEATPPEELIAKSTARREERLRRDEERREAAEAMEPAWKERVREDRDRIEDRDQPATAAPYDARQEPARVTLEVVPGDAAIYLDGRFLGTAGELAGGRPELVVDPGDHELEVVRPGYDSKRLSFSAESGETIELEVELDETE